MPTVSCPSCTRPLEVDDAYREWTVRCPHCSTEFVPAEVAPAPLERDRRDDRDDRPRRHDRDRRDDEDDYDRPRRRRPDPEREEWERHEAVRLAHGPGTWLEVCGWLGGLLLAGGALFWFVSALGQGNNGNGDEAVAVMFGLVSGFLALPYTIVMVVGGRKMRALSGYGWAMTASVVGVASVVLIYFVCVCAFVPIGFGIWGVVTLNNPVVQRAFERNPRVAEGGWND